MNTIRLIILGEELLDLLVLQVIGTVIPPGVSDDEIDLADMGIRIISLNEVPPGLPIVRLDKRDILGEHLRRLGRAGDEVIPHDGGDEGV